MDSVSQKGSTFVQVTGDKRRVKHMYVYKISICNTVSMAFDC